ncbi:MAG: hypothetical protein Q7V61_03755 [Actinomycetota bacterium]|nr:hypothetical protein [Actinomycetota bacterium]
MERSNQLASCLIHNGTVVNARDMVRAVETIEGLTYRQLLDGEVMAEGRATLVKIMAEPEGSTILVNGCLFLNVLSFRYMTFETAADGTCRFELVGDGMTLEITPVEDEDENGSNQNQRAVRLMEAESFDPESFVVLEDDDDEDGR